MLSWRFRLWPRFACLSLLQTQHRVRLDAICAPLIHTIHQRSHKTAMKFSVISQFTAPCTCYLMKWPDDAVCVRTSCDRTTSFLTHHAPHTQTSTSPKNCWCVLSTIKVMRRGTESSRDSDTREPHDNTQAHIGYPPLASSVSGRQRCSQGHAGVSVCGGWRR